jgi:ribosomal protein S18 acetylase RimI-like enzyme
MEFGIRNAQQSDNAKIRPLQEQIARLHFEGRPDIHKNEAPHYSDEDFAEILANPDHFVFIAENAGGEVVGYAFARVVKYRSHPVCRDFDSFHIDAFCVLERYRRQGIGRALFDRCRQKAVALKCRNVLLNVWSFNRGAIAFYEKCGMSPWAMRMELRLE